MLIFDKVNWRDFLNRDKCSLTHCKYNILQRLLQRGHLIDLHLLYARAVMISRKQEFSSQYLHGFRSPRRCDRSLCPLIQSML